MKSHGKGVWTFTRNLYDYIRPIGLLAFHGKNFGSFMRRFSGLKWRTFRLAMRTSTDLLRKYPYLSEDQSCKPCFKESWFSSRRQYEFSSRPSGSSSMRRRFDLLRQVVWLSMKRVLSEKTLFSFMRRTSRLLWKHP